MASLFAGCTMQQCWAPPMWHHKGKLCIAGHLHWTVGEMEQVSQHCAEMVDKNCFLDIRAIVF
jgi:hypothetical protein